jgi:hypothetical protein
VTSFEHLGLDWQVEYYPNANQGIMPESHIVWVQYTDSNFDNTFQGCVLYFPVLSLSWTSLNQIPQFQEYLPSGKRDIDCFYEVQED